MSDSKLVVNGTEIAVAADDAHAYYRLIHEIVLAGKTETIVFDVNLQGEPGKLALLVNPSTQATLFTNDVAAMSIPFYDSNAATLIKRYMTPYMEADSAE